MPEDKTIQIKCSEDFKKRVEESAKKDRRSVSSYGYLALQNQMNHDNMKDKDKSCSTCGVAALSTCDSCDKTTFSKWFKRNW
jgi:hypothetical protein